MKKVKVLVKRNGGSTAINISPKEKKVKAINSHGSKVWALIELLKNAYSWSNGE